MASRRSRRKRKLSLQGLTILLVEIMVSPFALICDLLGLVRRVDERWIKRFLVLVVIMTLGRFYIGNTEYHNQELLNRHQIHFVNVDETIPYASIINHYALKNGLDPRLVAAVISVESSFNANAVSKVGAKGLMQIMPGTWRDLMPSSTCNAIHNSSYREDICIFNPKDNISAGTGYLHQMLLRFDGQVGEALAAYNGGPGCVERVKDNITKGRLVGETIAYVHKVYMAWDRYCGSKRSYIIVGSKLVWIHTLLLVIGIAWVSIRFLRRSSLRKPWRRR